MRTEAIDDLRTDIGDRYDLTSETVQRALWRLGVPVQRGEPPGSFCPGNHSLEWGGKIVGLAQRVKTGVAIVGGIVVVRDHEAIADVLAAVYGALGLDFDPASVGSLAAAGGPSDPGPVVEALEDALRAAADADGDDGAVEVVTLGEDD